MEEFLDGKMESALAGLITPEKDDGGHPFARVGGTVR